MASDKQLQDLSNLLRRDVITMTTTSGSGHPTSCMSSAEIMSVLFFDTMSFDISNPNNEENDEFILSKGHSAPILYAILKYGGAIKDDLLTLRKLSSRLEGHPNPRSFPWAKVGTGSLGQGLSIGLGMAQTTKKNVYVLMGDGEIAEGSVYEACELASHYSVNNLIGIVDCNALGQSGKTMYGHKLAQIKKIFSSFGWEVKIVDGHNIKELRSVLSKKTNKPLMILAKTEKGKGVSFIEGKNGWHGKALKDQTQKALEQIPHPEMPKIVVKPVKKSRTTKEKLNTTISFSLNKDELIATREAYGKAIAQLTQKNKNIHVIDAEVRESTFSSSVLEKTPLQFTDAFIAEQNMVGVALGMAVKEKIVFASTFAAFFSRAHDQIRMSALSKCNLNFIGSHAGVSIGEDGVSQMGLEDLALFRSVPESIVLYPSDALSTLKLTVEMAKKEGIKYLRLTREKTPILYKSSDTFPIGDAKVFPLKGAKIVVIAAGITVREALLAQKELKKESPITVVDCYSIKPLPLKKLQVLTSKAKKIIVVEDHYEQGGLGEAISKALGKPITHLCVREIPHSGNSLELLKKYGIDSSAIKKEVLKL